MTDSRQSFVEQIQSPVLQGVLILFSNGRMYAFLLAVFALITVTTLGILHDIDSNAIVAILSAILGGAIGHANGNLQGKLEAFRQVANGEVTTRELRGQ